MDESGRVVEVCGGIARVEFTKKEACAGCGSRLICHFTPGDRAFTEASNEAGAEVGDLVRVEVDPRRSVLTGVLIFIFPIMVFIAVFAAAKGIVENESYRVLGGIICLVIYFIFLKKLESWFARRGTFRPVVRDVIESTRS
jgi:positive regulator of sigma E activity